jgi:Tfp pilus assembly protein PilX
MQTFNVRNERGIALVVAIVALVVIGAIVAGTFFISTIEERTAVNTTEAAQAYQAAEAGMQTTVANWSSAYNGMATDQSTTLSQASVGGAYYNVTVSRLNGSMFMIRSIGTRQSSTQTLAAVLRLITANPDVGAAVTAKGNVTIGGSAEVYGENTTPGGWACASAPDKGGVRTSGTVTTSGNSYTLEGNPDKIENDATVNDALFQGPFNQLRQLANLTLAPGTYNGMTPTTTGSPARCNSANTNNWGEPHRGVGAVTECTSYAPVILVDGNISIQNGRGQGVLLVTGDLDIRGNVEFTGLVIALGQVKTNGTGSKITGAVMANNVDLNDQTSFVGNPTVSYSKCAVDYVLQQSAIARPIASRAWTQVF